MFTVGFVTGSRADYGLLRPLIQEVDRCETLAPLLFVTGQHLAARFGSTVDEIRSDGWPVAASVPLPLEDDTDVATVRATSVALAGLGDAFEHERPDMVCLLGDRFEILAGALAAFLLGIPLVHLHGGELTLGALDDGMRHAITKLATLHLTSTEEYRRRVVQMGEDPRNVHTVGALGVDCVMSQKLMTAEMLCEETGFSFRHPSMMVTYHPETAGGIERSVAAACEFTRGLSLLDGWNALVTGSNADAGGRATAAVLREWVAEDPERRVYVESLGSKGYVSAAARVDVVVGNSSSALIEVPSLGTPSVDVGSRQEGRIRPASVLHCGSNAEEIAATVRAAVSDEFVQQAREAVSPYGDGNAAARCADIMERWLAGKRTASAFHDIGSNGESGTPSTWAGSEQ